MVENRSELVVSLGDLGFDQETQRLRKKVKTSAPDWDCRDFDEAKSFPPERRFHLFTDGRLKPDPRYNDRYGSIAAGGVLVDANGYPRRKVGKALGMGSNQDGEIKAVLVGLQMAEAYFDQPQDKIIVAHTDSRYVQAGLCMADFFKKDHLRAAASIYELCPSFTRVYFQWTSAANYGIRNAETQAWKALNRELGTNLTWRGSKGGDSSEDLWNPFEGEDGWMD